MRTGGSWERHVSSASRRLGFPLPGREATAHILGRGQAQPQVVKRLIRGEGARTPTPPATATAPRTALQPPRAHPGEAPECPTDCAHLLWVGRGGWLPVRVERPTLDVMSGSKTRAC